MDLITSILLVLIGLTIGYLLHALVASIRKKPEEQATGQVPPPAAFPEEAVRLWHNPSNQKFLVEVGGEVFHSAGESNQTQRERLAGYAVELVSWLGGSEELSPPVEPPPMQIPAQVSPFSPEVPLPVPEPSRAVSDEPEGQDLNPLKIFSRVFQSVNKAPAETGPESIVAQIDALLQVRLEGTHLASRGIRLVETPGQGMTVQVGLESYGTVEDIPDPEVQAAIRQAVADWEAGLVK
jgi:hypothetical protein